MAPPKLKEIFDQESVFKYFYTGGDVEWSEDGKLFLCQCIGSIQFLDVDTGSVTGYIGEDKIPSEDVDVDLVVTFKLSPDNESIISAHKSGLFKLWSVKDKKLMLHWRSVHKGPISKLAFSQNGLILASGGSDSTVRLWDLERRICFRNLIGMRGVCSVLEFVEIESKQLVFAAGDDGVIKAWRLSDGKVKLSLEGHYSTVTGIVFSHDMNYIISCSRDKVIILWEMKTGKKKSVIPTYECLESLVILPKSITLPFRDIKLNDSVYVATAGERGVIRIWDVLAIKEVFVQSDSLVKKNEDGGLAVVRLLYCPSSASMAVISYDHNIFINSLDNFVYTHQFVGYSDEILDIVYVGEEESHIVVATNSPDIKLYALSTMACTLLTGHTGFVVNIAVSAAQPNVFASASKDNSLRVWMLIGKTAVCIASGMYHNNSVNAVSLSQLSLSFLLSGGEDNILKMWKIPKNFGTGNIDNQSPPKLELKNTCLAHDKAINGIAVSPNDQFIGTASLDKTAKLWSASNLSLLGTLRGHRRGIWSIVFSPVDQVVLTISGDTTLKIWSIADLSCLKTLEGHESSVMKASFLSRGMQIISSSGDGLIKLWNIKTSECVASFDGHTGKVWALAVSRDEMHLVSGCSDSKMIIWKDVTEERQVEKAEKERQKTLKEQELSNLIKAGDFLSALKLALSLERPNTVLIIVREVIKRGGSGLSETVLSLETSEKHSLLNCAAHWNTNSKTAYAAQYIISILLNEISSGKLNTDRSMIEALIPYTERHFNRLTQLLQDLKIIDYVMVMRNNGSI